MKVREKQTTRRPVTQGREILNLPICHHGQASVKIDPNCANIVGGVGGTKHLPQ
jgi:hypothetical protein